MTDKKWGGKREGAGRPKGTLKKYIKFSERQDFALALDEE